MFSESVPGTKRENERTKLKSKEIRKMQWIMYSLIINENNISNYYPRQCECAVSFTLQGPVYKSKCIHVRKTPFPSLDVLCLSFLPSWSFIHWNSYSSWNFQDKELRKPLRHCFLEHPLESIGCLITSLSFYSWGRSKIVW